jgi:hypothetical protein
MDTRALDAIFAQPTDEDAQDKVDALITPQEWPLVCDYVLAVLADPQRSRAAWELAAAVVWGACCDDRPLPIDRTIALVYARLRTDPDSSENNLAWSIASKLKRVSYLSEYDPLRDPNIVLELARIPR